ncbi:MAG: pseudouridine synthase [Bacteriovoracaceae bacterium]|nr:pseudouridine synthase [Bacteriovoracaceae bacterium]
MNNLYVAFYKPYGVLSQFTGEKDQRTLADFNLPAGVYAAGRLDKDSEGLLVLTNDGPFIKKLSDPKSNKEKTYWVQVEGEPGEDDLLSLRSGPIIQGYKCLPCQAKVLHDFELPPRDPPIRERKSIPTSWLEVRLIEGKNRQVRRMCAAIGFPCLRLIRSKVGKYSIDSLKAGEWSYVKKEQII